MNSIIIPLLYSLQRGCLDADQWIDQLLNRPYTIDWQGAFTHPLPSDRVGACIFDVDPNTGLKVYEEFFTLKVHRINKIVPRYPYVYRYEYDAIIDEDVMVVDTIDLKRNKPLFPLMLILK